MRLFSKFVTDFEYIRAKMRIGLFFSILGFPLYYYFWAHLFPQSYENIYLRLAGVLFALLWIVSDYTRKDHERFHYCLSVVALTFAAPFFFTYMFLQNGASGVWLGSLICAVLYLAIVADAVSLLFMFLVGVPLAYLVYLIQPHQPVAAYDVLEALPVIFFALSGALAMKWAEEWTIRANKRKAVALAGSIAHELRTPLLGVRLELEHFHQLCDELDERLGADKLQYTQVSDRLSRHVQKASHIVDCLLLNVREENFDRSGFTHHSMKQVLDDVLSRYPLSEKERSLINIHQEYDFTFWGDDLLMAHVLMNLLKNALSAIAAAEKGNVEIYFSRISGKNAMCVRDTGRGIKAAARKKVFDRFYSETSGGAGLGLAFCKRVVDSFGGEVECYSEAGMYTEFRVLLPAGERL
ncbi:sensor histidine kinase [Kordiimonas aestuarii]|uniref:sensor histidine kinase n=1 Tax=Kordiimonas aestuarii TaxID=1005925 RepID=UPI0021D3E36B|nr:HAMP domain-containing sensor histidine kinase [Kordiimonas aestuarii]